MKREGLEVTSKPEKKLKLDPQRISFSIQYLHNVMPPDLKLAVQLDLARWFDAVALLSELCNCDRKCPNGPPPVLHCAIAARG